MALIVRRAGKQRGEQRLVEAGPRQLRSLQAIRILELFDDELDEPSPYVRRLLVLAKKSVDTSSAQTPKAELLDSIAEVTGRSA